MNKSLEIKDDPKAMLAIKVLKEYALSRGYTVEQIIEAIKPYDGKKEDKR